MNPVGFVVVEWNQASGMPNVADETVYGSPEQADERAAEMRDDTALRGRRERYAVAELVVDEEPR